MDLNTENPEVISTLQKWVADYVKDYQIDGLRIDGEFSCEYDQRYKLTTQLLSMSMVPSGPDSVELLHRRSLRRRHEVSTALTWFSSQLRG
jgi:1,4-alpha-glucan branching enzyme